MEDGALSGRKRDDFYRYILDTLFVYLTGKESILIFGCKNGCVLVNVDMHTQRKGARIEGREQRC